MVGILRAQGRPVAARRRGGPARDPRRQRPRAARRGRAGCCATGSSRRWMRDGVTVVDPATTWIDVDVSARPRRRRPAAAPSCSGTTVVAAGAEVGPDTTLRDCRGRRGRPRPARDAEPRGDRPAGERRPVRLPAPRHRCSARGQERAPSSRLKNAVVGEGAKVPHLSYVGDAEIGEGTNIGAATIFVNYDGVNKHRTTIGDHVRTGSDNMFVAPVDGRRRRLHRGRLGDHRGRAPGGAGRRPGAAAQRSRAGSSASAAGTASAEAARSAPGRPQARMGPAAQATQGTAGE